MTRRIHWWAPSLLVWWVGVLFIVGSACFALGAFPPYAAWVGATADGVTYFVGSLCFTSAAALQLRLGGNRLVWWSGLVQFAGTLFFNRSTFQALNHNLSVAETDTHVWRPDVLGSIAFLVSSVLVCADVGWRSLAHGRGPGWWAAWLNMAGSVAFGVSAAASFVITESDMLRNAERANLGTFVGALCFLAGAVFILPRDDAEATSAVKHDADLMARPEPNLMPGPSTETPMTQTNWDASTLAMRTTKALVNLDLPSATTSTVFTL